MYTMLSDNKTHLSNAVSDYEAAGYITANIELYGESVGVKYYALYVGKSLVPKRKADVFKNSKAVKGISNEYGLVYMGWDVK